MVERRGLAMNIKLLPNFCIHFVHEGLTLSCGVGPGHFPSQGE